MKTTKTIPAISENRQNKQSALRFSRELYPRSTLRSAVERFKEFGVFKISSREKCHHVDIRDTEPGEDRDRLIDEFKNYVLYLAIIDANT